MIGVIGGVLTWAGYRGKRGHEIPALAIHSAASLACSDIIYAGSGRIRKIYLLEALVEAGIIVLWVARLVRYRR